MKNSLRTRGTSRDIVGTSISILLQSSKLKINELEKITELFSETLSNSFSIKLQMDKKDIRVLFDVQTGISNSLSVNYRLEILPQPKE